MECNSSEIGVNDCRKLSLRLPVLPAPPDFLYISTMRLATAKACRNASRLMFTRSCSERGPLRQRLILLVTLIAFAFQSYVVQTHIHVLASSNSGIAISKNFVTDSKWHAASTQTRDQGRYPPGDDPTHCPICQEFLLAGQYVTPAPVTALLLTVVVVPVAVVSEIAVPFIPVSHNWYGRAPPTA
jgi:hypothetical protein